MVKLHNLISESFTKDQQRLATSGLEQALAKIDRETIGSNWNRRQMDMLTIVGAWEEADPTRSNPARPNVSEIEDTFERELGATKPALQADINGPIEAGLCEKVLRQGSKKEKFLVMTPKGQAEWMAYSNERVALLLALSMQIRKVGKTPPSWTDKIMGWLRYLDRRAGKAAAAAVFIFSLAGAPTEVEANVGMSEAAQISSTLEVPPNWTMQEVLGEGPWDSGSVFLGDPAASFAKPVPTVQFKLDATFGGIAAALAVTRNNVVDVVQPTPTSGVQNNLAMRAIFAESRMTVVNEMVADRSTVFENLLPKAQVVQRTSDESILLGLYNEVRGSSLVNDQESSQVFRIADREGVFDKLLPKIELSTEASNF